MCAPSPGVSGSPVWRAHGGRNSISPSSTQQTFVGPDAVGTAVPLAPEAVGCQGRAYVTWGSRGDFSEFREAGRPAGPRVCYTAPSRPSQAQTQESGWGPPGPPHTVRSPPAPPNIPEAQCRGLPPLALILTPSKVPIVHFQSCFKVTLISKLLAALAGDYSCINQGEIMPVTD